MIILIKLFLAVYFWTLENPPGVTRGPIKIKLGLRHSPLPRECWHQFSSKSVRWFLQTLCITFLPLWDPHGLTCGPIKIKLRLRHAPLSRQCWHQFLSKLVHWFLQTLCKTFVGKASTFGQKRHSRVPPGSNLWANQKMILQRPMLK